MISDSREKLSANVKYDNKALCEVLNDQDHAIRLALRFVADMCEELVFDGDWYTDALYRQAAPIHV